MSQTFIIHGEHIHDLETLYCELNKTFMGNEDWEIAQSLDAFNDLLYGGFGMIPAEETVEIIWKNFEQNKNTFDKAFTIKWYEQKLDQSQHYNIKWIRQQIADLEHGEGQTYFDIILEIISDHKKIRLIKA